MKPKLLHDNAFLIIPESGLEAFPIIAAAMKQTMHQFKTQSHFSNSPHHLIETMDCKLHLTSHVEWAEGLQVQLLLDSNELPSSIDFTKYFYLHTSTNFFLRKPSIYSYHPKP